MPIPSLPLAPRTRAARRAYWQNILSQWQGSGERIGEFCARRDLTPKAFYRWRRRLARDGNDDGSRPMVSPPAGVFQSLALAPAGEVEVLLAHGARVRLSGAAAERLVSQLLEHLAC